MSDLTIMNKVVRDAHKSIYEVQKFLSSPWNEAILECIDHDYKKFSHQARDVAECSRELSQSIANIRLPSLDFKYEVLHFRNEYHYDIINKIFESHKIFELIQNDVKFYYFDFLHTNIRGVMSMLPKITSHINETKSTYKKIITAFDEFINEECNNSDIISGVCNITISASRLFTNHFKQIDLDFNKSLIIISSFNENLNKISEECIYDKFGCKYTRNNDANNDGMDTVTCFDYVPGEAADIMQKQNTINIHGHNTTNQSYVTTHYEF